MKNLITRILVISVAAAFSLSAVAGHHEEGEAAMKMAKDKGAQAKEAMMDKSSESKGMHDHKNSHADEAKMKAKMEKAQHQEKMEKMTDEAEAEMGVEVEAEVSKPE